MLEQERKAIQPHQEEIEVINLGTEEDKKEIKIGALLDARAKERIVELLREYSDIFAWSYKDMPGSEFNHCSTQTQISFLSLLFQIKTQENSKKFDEHIKNLTNVHHP